MQTWEIILTVIAVLIVAGVVVWSIYNRRRSERLQRQFGPEYDRAVEGFGSRRRAEAELARREAHARRLRNRPLDASARAHAVEDWHVCQQKFVDDPAGAVEDADDLLIRVMRIRGYRADNAYDRMMDISAAYPEHINRYREAGEILVHHRRGEASTDSLRQAFLHYKTLFDDLLGVSYEESKRAA